MTRTHTMTMERSGTLAGAEGENEYVVTYTIKPGTPESGNFGPPENYDPGSPAEVDLLTITRDGNANARVNPHEEEWLIDYIVEHHDFADEAAERAEYLADQRRDQRMLDRMGDA